MVPKTKIRSIVATLVFGAAAGTLIAEKTIQDRNNARQSNAAESNCTDGSDESQRGSCLESKNFLVISKE